MLQTNIGEIVNSRAHMNGSKPAASVARKKVRRSGKPLPKKQADAILAMIEADGLGRLLDEMGKIDPATSRKNADKAISRFIVDRHHRWYQRNLDTLSKIAREYAPTPRALPDVVATQPVALSVADVIAIARKVAAEEREQAAPKQLPAATQSFEVKSLADLPAHAKLELIRNYHRAAANKLREEGVATGNPMRAAYDITYEEFERTSGMKFRDMAWQEQRDTGKRVLGTDVIARLGYVDQFLECTKRVWSKE